MKKKAVIVDLDGTLLKVNTFEKYVYFSLKETLMSLKIYIVIEILFFLVIRKLRFISHTKLKYHILLKTNVFYDKFLLFKFVDSLLEDRNNQVIEKIHTFKKDNYFICLSTAAPFNYASIIANYFKMDACLATPVPISMGQKEWQENIRNNKCNNTLSFLNNNNLTFSVFFTDHYDDIDLLKIRKEKNFLVNPNKKTVDEVESNGIDYQLIIDL